MMSALKKILLLSVRSDIGGGPKHLFILARSLKLKNIPFIIASPLDPPYGEKFQETAYKHSVLPTRSFSMKAFFHLLRLLYSEEITLIHSHGRGAGLYSRLLSLATRGKIPVIHTFHGVHQEKSFVGLIKAFIDRLFAPLARKYICVSSYERETAVLLKFAAVEKITVIHNGIDVEFNKSHFEQLSIVESRKMFSMNAEKCVLGTLARLDFIKGLDLALQLISQIKRRRGTLDFSLIIAGDGPEKARLQKMTSVLELDNDIFFTGEVDDPFLFLRGLDIYVSFSRSEGLPFSVLEAMSCSLSCLLSDISGHRSLSEKGGVQLFSLDDFKDFETKVIHLINNPLERKDRGEKAFQAVVKHYTEKTMLEKTFTLWKNSQI